MPDDRQPLTGPVRHTWEILFCLHLAFLGVSIAFLRSLALVGFLSRMDYRINEFLHIRQSDFEMGYWATAIPTVLVAVLLWSALRAVARTRFAQETLGWPAGIITISAPLWFWALADQRALWPASWPFEGAPFEMAIALVCAVLFLAGRWTVPYWASLLLVASHYALWHFAGGLRLVYTVIGLCSVVAWGLYVSQMKRVNAVGTPLVS